MYNELAYWNSRYARGISSGDGSTGTEGAWKAAQVIDAARGVSSVADFGHGDGQIACAVMSSLDNSVIYRGYDIAPSAALLAISRMRPNMTCEVADFTSPSFSACADMVMCIDVLFHLSTAEKHDAAIAAICRSFRRVAIVSTWNENIVAQHKAGLSSHCFYRPFVVPSGIVAEARVVPCNPSKTLFVLTRA